MFILDGKTELAGAPLLKEAGWGRPFLQPWYLAPLSGRGRDKTPLSCSLGLCVGYPSWAEHAIDRTQKCRCLCLAGEEIESVSL